MIWSSDDDDGSGGVPRVSGCRCLPAEPCPEAVSSGFCLDPRLLVERRRECGREWQDQGIVKQNTRILEYCWHSASGSGGSSGACRQSQSAGAWQGGQPWCSQWGRSDGMECWHQGEGGERNGMSLYIPSSMWYREWVVKKAREAGSSGAMEISLRGVRKGELLS